jgi:hypothetical protein
LLAEGLASDIEPILILAPFLKDGFNCSSTHAFKGLVNNTLAGAINSVILEPPF